MTVLAFDCSTARGTVAVFANGTVLFREDFDSPRGRGGRFFPVLEAAVRAAGQPDRVAVDDGIGLGRGRFSAGIAGR